MQYIYIYIYIVLYVVYTNRKMYIPSSAKQTKIVWFPII